MKRYLLFGLLTLCLVGCSSSQPKLLGTWENVNTGGESVNFLPDGILSVIQGMDDWDYTISGNDVIERIPEAKIKRNPELSQMAPRTGTVNGDTLIFRRGSTVTSTLKRVFSSSSQNNIIGTWKGTEKGQRGEDVSYTLTFLSDGRAVVGMMGTYTIQNGDHIVLHTETDGSSPEYLVKINGDLLTLHDLKEKNHNEFYVRVK